MVATTLIYIARSFKHVYIDYREFKLSSRSKTYNVTLVDGTFDGTKIISDETLCFDGVFFHRDNYSSVKSNNGNKIHKQGIYFLLKFDSDNIEKIYVGKTDTGISRIYTHIQEHKKDWFEFCYIVTSNRTEPISKNIIDALEHSYIEILKNNSSFECDNSNTSHVHLNSRDEIHHELFKKEIDFLLEAAGIKINQNYTKSSNPQGCLNFRIGRNKLKSYMKFSPSQSKYTVLRGSQIDMRKGTKSVTGDALRRREELFNGCNKIEILNCDVDFSSASAASSFVIGNSSNGKVDWVSSDSGEPLKTFSEAVR